MTRCSGRLLCVGNGNQSPTPSPWRRPPDYLLGHSSASQWRLYSVPLLLINNLVKLLAGPGQGGAVGLGCLWGEWAGWVSLCLIMGRLLLTFETRSLADK